MMLLFLSVISLPCAARAGDGWTGAGILAGGKSYAQTPMGQVHYRGAEFTGGKVFFSEEKKQKTFMSGAAATSGHGLDLGGGGETKIFWFFSSEKNAFLPILKK